MMILKTKHATQHIADPTYKHKPMTVGALALGFNPIKMK